MPKYDYRCPACDTTYTDVYFPLRKYVERPFDWCPRHGHRRFEQLLSIPNVEDWGNCSEGRCFENLAPEGLRFRDRRSYEEHLKRNGLVEWGRKRGMPGQEV